MAGNSGTVSRNNSFVAVLALVTDAVACAVRSMKYVRPVYRALFTVDKQLAIKNFRAHKGFYHPICGRIVAKDLGIEY